MTDSVYRAPESELGTNSEEHSKAGRVLAIVGSVLLLSIPVSVFVFLLRMAILFNEISSSGTGNPQVMAAGISEALVPVVLGLMSCIPGVICLILATSVYRYRRPWVFWVSLVASMIALLLVPIGTVLALILIVLLVVKRSYFFSSNPAGLE